MIQRLHPENGIDLTYVGSPGDAGDQYAGLDRFGRVINQKWVNNSSSVVDQYLYSYDRNSNRTSRDNELNTDFDEDYTYDNLNRLTATDRDSVDYQSWDLDALGNSNSVTTQGSTETRTHNSQNQLTGMGGDALTFDANGNTITDQHGRTLVYDAWNRMVEAKSGSTSLVRYEFDGAKRRIQEGDNHLYFSNGWQILEERNAGDDTTNSYVWSPVYVDAMIARDRDSDSDGSLDERLYVLQDANSNVIAIADDSGTIQERFVYDAYGMQTVLAVNWTATTDSKSWRQGHQGGFYDSVMPNQMLFRHRDYDAEQMRWIQQDPLRYVDGVNVYQFVKGNPIKYLDPAGLLILVKRDASSKIAGFENVVLNALQSIVGPRKAAVSKVKDFTLLRGIRFPSMACWF